MRDADDFDEERKRETSGQRRKDDDIQNKNKFGSHRRGHQTDSSDHNADEADKHNGRVNFAGSRSAQNSALAINSRTSPRSYNEGGNRFVFQKSTLNLIILVKIKIDINNIIKQNNHLYRKPMGTHTRDSEHNTNKVNSGKGFAQARLERNKQQRSGSSSEQVGYKFSTKD